MGDMHILIVDSDDTHSRSLVDVVMRHGFTATRANSTESAIRKFHECPADMALLEDAIPGLGGEETARHLRELARDPILPIIFLKDGAVQSAASLVGDCLVKPVSPRALESKLLQSKEVIAGRRRIADSTARYQAVLDCARDGVIVFSESGDIEQFNTEAEQIFGLTAEEAKRKQIGDLVDLCRRKSETPALLAAMDRSVWELEGVRADGTQFPMEIRVGKVALPEATFFAVVRNITERKQQEAKIIALANQDSLTGLPNRVLMADRLNQMISHSKRFQKLAALLFIDLDNFKGVNDTRGHDAGDDVLREVARRLLECVRETDTVARVGGDEFVALLSDIRDPDDVGTVAERIRVACNSEINEGGISHLLSASIGIAVYPNDGMDAAALMKHADTAMYHAKGQGRNNYQFFSEEMNQRALERSSMERRLRHAILKKEFALYYQPQIDIRNNRVIGAEALIRWLSPEGLIGPTQFIPLAEETGLISSLGDWVLQTACEQNRRWQLAGLPHIRVAVNLSARQFNARLPQYLKGLLANANLANEYLEIEFTESLLINNVDEAINIMRELSDMGIHMSIDDFGTGYSSLGYLKRFPIDSIKIDRAFVHDLHHDENGKAITSAIIAMAKQLKLRTIAEGVEHPEQLALLDALGCESYQGFYHSRPMPASEFTQLLISEAAVVKADLTQGNANA